MTKKQKIALAISLALFAIPELLWSPILNFYYELFQEGDVHPLRNNMLFNSDNLVILKATILIQLLGILSLFLIILFSKFKNRASKLLLVATMVILLLIAGFANYYVLYSNPQIG